MNKRKRYSASFKAKVSLEALRGEKTMETSFCVEELEEALARYGTPEIFNTDQGSKFTSLDFTDVLKGAGIRISMDGKGRWVDNVFIERLWRSLKYESVYLNAFETGSEARAGIDWWIEYYNGRRPHSTFDGATPNAPAISSALMARLNPFSQPFVDLFLNPGDRSLTQIDGTRKTPLLDPQINRAPG